MQPAAPHRDLERNIVEFCRRLREHDLLVTPAEVIDALRTVETIDLGDRTEMKLALRSVLTARREDVPVFNDLFDEFWRSRELEGGDDHFTSREANLTGHGQPVHSTSADSTDDEQRHEGSEASQSSSIEVLARHDFRDFKAEQLDDIRRAVVLIAQRLANRQRSRRYHLTLRGRLVDLRRSMRRNMKYGGTLIELARRRRKLRKPRVVLLCDVSRSMELYSTFLLQFVYALQNTGLGMRVESFVFSTRLTRVTDYFKTDDIVSALERVAREAPDWAGGTRIGDSLTEFNRHWALRVLDRHTIVVVLSDGLDSGLPSVLGAQLEQIERRAARVVWLNPLLGDPTYQPVARTMRAALRHVSVFAPAHNLASLQELGRQLVT